VRPKSVLRLQFIQNYAPPVREKTANSAPSIGFKFDVFNPKGNNVTTLKGFVGGLLHT
jgi:hypothetical protein